MAQRSRTVAAVLSWARPGGRSRCTEAEGIRETYFNLCFPVKIEAVSFHIAAAQNPSAGPKSGPEIRAIGDLQGRSGMYLLTVFRGIMNLFQRRYRPEQHYMRGPGPKWFERHRR
jgi:hypothetical protein